MWMWLWMWFWMRHKSRGSLLRESGKSGKGAWWSVLTGDIQGTISLQIDRAPLIAYRNGEMDIWLGLINTYIYDGCTLRFKGYTQLVLLVSLENLFSTWLDKFLGTEVHYQCAKGTSKMIYSIFVESLISILVNSKHLVNKIFDLVMLHIFLFS